MDDVTSMSLEGTLMALAHSILINLFIKLELNNFSPTSPTKYCFCPRAFSRLQVLDEGRLERCSFCPKNREPGYEFVEWIDHDIGHLGFMCSSFVNMLFFDYRFCSHVDESG